MSGDLRNLISKDNISILFKQILEKENIENKDDKQILINILRDNMKKAYKKIDKNKITSSNILKIKNQFNNICITETVNNFRNPKSIQKHSKINSQKISNPQKKTGD